MLREDSSESRSMQETFVRLPLSVSATTFVWWLNRQVVGADRVIVSRDGPSTVVAILYWRDWTLAFFDDADEEKLMLGAKYCVLDLGPGSCQLEAVWALGKDHEYFPMYLEVIKDAEAEFGTGERVVLPWAGQASLSTTTATDGQPIPRPETERRAKLFRHIKDAQPTLSYAQVATRANQEDNPETPYTEDHVRYAYRAMGWRWERADRVR